MLNFAGFFSFDIFLSNIQPPGGTEADGPQVGVRGSIGDYAKAFESVCGH